MLILPIVNKNRILNVRVSLKGVEKARHGVNIADIFESDIIVNGRAFSKSYFSDSKDPKAMVDFIRNNLVSQNRGYSVVTKRALDTKTCDVYEVDVPPAKVSDVFDLLYSKALLDMQKEVPGVVKSKYLSLKNIGFDSIFSDDNVRKVRKIVSNVYDRNYWMGMFQEEGLTQMLQIINLMTLFDFVILSEASILESQMVEMISSFDKINSKDTKNLNNYYNMALDNRDIYGKMSYVSKMVYDRPLDLIQSSVQKRNAQLIKTSERELNQVA